MGLHPRRFPYAILPALLCLACSGGSSTARLPELDLPAGLSNGGTLTEEAAHEAFLSWTAGLPAEPTIPLSVTYQLDAGFDTRGKEGENTSGSAVGTIDFLFYDRERARADAFLVLAMPDQPQPWHLTGSLQFDGFFLRAWGTGDDVPGLDPERIYASQFEQGVLEDTYASLVQLMPRLLRALDDRGVAGSALLDRDLQSSVIDLMHPQGLIELAISAFHCLHLKHDDQGLHATLALDVREGAPLRPLMTSLLDVPPELLEAATRRFTVDLLMEPHTGLILGTSFQAEVRPTPLQPDLPHADLHFRLDAQGLQWQVEDLDAVIARPEGLDPLDLTAMLQVADKFLKERGAELDAAEDFELED